jgi:hypothetical protein
MESKRKKKFFVLFCAVITRKMITSYFEYSLLCGAPKEDEWISDRHKDQNLTFASPASPVSSYQDIGMMT